MGKHCDESRWWTWVFSGIFVVNQCVLFAAERTREGMSVIEAGLSAIEAEKNKDPIFKRVMEQAEED